MLFGPVSHYFVQGFRTELHVGCFRLQGFPATVNEHSVGEVPIEFLRQTHEIGVHLRVVVPILFCRLKFGCRTNLFSDMRRLNAGG